MRHRRGRPADVVVPPPPPDRAAATNRWNLIGLSHSRHPHRPDSILRNTGSTSSNPIRGPASPSYRVGASHPHHRVHRTVPPTTLPARLRDRLPPQPGSGSDSNAQSVLPRTVRRRPAGPKPEPQVRPPASISSTECDVRRHRAAPRSRGPCADDDVVVALIRRSRVEEPGAVVASRQCSRRGPRQLAVACPIREFQCGTLDFGRRHPWGDPAEMPPSGRTTTHRRRTRTNVIDSGRSIHSAWPRAAGCSAPRSSIRGPLLSGWCRCREVRPNAGAMS